MQVNDANSLQNCLFGFLGITCGRSDSDWINMCAMIVNWNVECPSMSKVILNGVFGISTGNRFEYAFLKNQDTNRELMSKFKGKKREKSGWRTGISFSGISSIRAWSMVALKYLKDNFVS